MFVQTSAAAARRSAYFALQSRNGNYNPVMALDQLRAGDDRCAHGQGSDHGRRPAAKLEAELGTGTLATT